MVTPRTLWQPLTFLLSCFYQTVTRIMTKHTARYLMKRARNLLLSIRPLLLTGLLMPLLANAAFTASVNKTVIASHETLELTLHTDVNSSDVPDLSPLEWSFDVLGTRQQSKTNNINGKWEYARDWVITLTPKQQGTLIIPPIKLGDQESEPITIKVCDKQEYQPGNDSSPLFMKAEVSSESIYVQQELILTLQIFFSVQLYDNKSLSALDIDDALIQQLGETRQFDTIIDGIRYLGIELKFSIHPQAVGDMVIPSLTFTGVAMESRDPFASLFSNSGKPVIARSPEIRIEVKPQPESYPSKETWLPAKNLTIQEKWSQPLSTLKVGDAITRTITVKADGLTAAQLPPILMSQPSGVNSYPDKSGTEDRETRNGIQGQRTDSIAMIPTQSGTITLPAVEYIWFDTTSGKVNTAKLPATTLHVAPDPKATEQTSTVAVTPPEDLDVKKTDDSSHPAVIASQPNENTLRLWQFLTALFLLLWLVTLGFWRFKSNKNKPRDYREKANDALQSPESPLQEADAFARLESACQQKNVRLALSELQNWSHAFTSTMYPNHSESTCLTDCLNLIGSSKLKTICNELSGSLYSAQTNTADTETLLYNLMDECRSVRAKKTEKETNPELGKLYPE